MKAEESKNIIAPQYAFVIFVTKFQDKNANPRLQTATIPNGASYTMVCVLTAAGQEQR